MLSGSFQGEELPAVDEDSVRDYLSEHDPRKIMGPGGLHMKVLRACQCHSEAIPHPLELLWRAVKVL